MKKMQTILILVLAMTVLAGCAASASTLPPQGETIGEMLTVNTPTNPAPTSPQRLTAEEAQAIALADAGLTTGDVTRQRTEFEYDDGIPEYEVDFRAGDFEYDYTIHAETGAVRSRSREYDPIDTTPPASIPPAAEPAPPRAETITADQAADIALAHAGLTRADVNRLAVHYDPDDGVPVYDVEFHHAGTEYDFEIHAETGAIRDFDRDR